MKVTTTHFQVGNGDMTLITSESGRRVLVDCRITLCADDPNDDTADVGTQLRDLLGRDGRDRLHVDVFPLTHPDQDHCAGLRPHFLLGLADTPFTGLPLAPLLASSDDEAELHSKNNSSVIVRMSLSADGNPEAARCLLSGDVEVAIGEKILDRYRPEDLK